MSIFVVPFSRLNLFGLGEQEACLSRGAEVIVRALRLLETRQDFHFLLEDLAPVDYFLKAHPEDLERIRAQIAEGRLEVGATWTGIGQNLQIGEDLVRNLLYGKGYASEVLGADSPTAHLGDAPGWTPQYPQIARKCGVTHAVFTRCGPRDRMLFAWEGLDGSKVRVWHAPGGCDLLWDAVRGEPAKRRKRNREIAATREQVAGLLPVHWGGALTQMSEEALEDLAMWAEGEEVEVILGTPGGYFQREDAAGDRSVLSGEAPSVQPFVESLFPGVTPHHTPAVHGLLRAEQMAAAANLICGFPYPGAALKAAWLWQLEAMETHFDGAGAGDALARKRRHQQMAIWTAEEVCRGAERAVAERVAAGDGPPGTLPLVVFNPLSWTRTDVAEAQVTFYGEEDATDFSRYEMYKIVDASGETVLFQELVGGQTVTAEMRLVFVASEVPANGYATYYLVPNVPESAQLVGIQARGMMAPEFPEPRFVVDDVEDRVSEPYRGVRIGRRFTNTFYGLEVDEITGRVILTDRRLDRALMEGMHLVGWEESMREGLTQYDYTGRRFEMEVDRVDLEESGEVRATLLVAGRLLTSPFELRFRLYGALDRVDVELRLHWQDTKPVRVQMVFPVDLEKADVRYGVPYGHTMPGGMMPGCEPYREGDMQAGTWGKQRECQGWIALDWENGGVVLAADRRAFEFEGGDVRGDVLRSCIDPASYAYKRVWRTYPEVCACRYSIRGYAGDFRTATAHRDGWALNQGLHVRSVYGRDSSRHLPDRLSFVRLEGPGLVTTVLKPAEDGEGCVLRAFETLGQPCEAQLTACCEILSARETDLLERPTGNLDPGAVRFDPFEIKTIRLVLRKAR